MSAALLIRETGAIVLAGSNEIEQYVDEIKVTDTKVINEPKEPKMYLLDREVGLQACGWFNDNVLSLELLTELYGAPVDETECYGDLWYSWVLITEEGDRLEIWCDDPAIAEGNGELDFIFGYDDEAALEAFKEDLDLSDRDYVLC